MSDIDDRVKEMAKLIVPFNRISEMHEKNMKTYPFIFFDGIKGCKIDYDLSTQANIDEKTDKKRIIVKAPIRNHFVAYHLTMDPEARNHNLDVRFSTLESAIKSLFWKSVILRVYFNDKLVYESKKK